jgi:hypothetical protein
MRYNISKSTALVMPNLGKGTKCIKILLSQVSENMQEPMVPMFFPILGAHISGAEFQYPDFSWKEPTGMMANIVAHSGDNKGQLTTLAKAVCRDFRQHDEAEEKIQNAMALEAQGGFTQYFNLPEVNMADRLAGKLGVSPEESRGFLRGKSDFPPCKVNSMDLGDIQCVPRK